MAEISWWSFGVLLLCKISDAKFSKPYSSHKFEPSLSKSYEYYIHFGSHWGDSGYSIEPDDLIDLAQ